MKLQPAWMKRTAGADFHNPLKDGPAPQVIDYLNPAAAPAA